MVEEPVYQVKAKIQHKYKDFNQKFINILSVLTSVSKHSKDFYLNTRFLNKFRKK